MKSPQPLYQGQLAIRKNAYAILLVHNHPSSYPEPSDEDHQITEIMKKAGKLLGIPVLDHVVIGVKQYYSFNVRLFLRFILNPFGVVKITQDL